MYLQQREKYVAELQGITDARHRICLDFPAAWVKRQSGNKRLEAARALCSPYLHKVYIPWDINLEISTPEVTASTQCGRR